MGFTPREVDAMGLWEFLACLDGYRASQGDSAEPKGGGNIEEADLRAMGIVGF